MLDPTRYNPRDYYWIIGNDIMHAYSSLRAEIVAVDDSIYTEWIEAGGQPTCIDTLDNLIDVLRGANVPPYHSVPKSRIIALLSDAQVTAALGKMTDKQKERWRAPDKPSVYADDGETRAILSAIGADPNIILAPE